MGKITRTNFGLTKTVTLTNAQILSFCNSPVEIAPALSDAVYVGIGAYLLCDHSAGDYVVNGGSSILFSALGLAAVDAGSILVSGSVREVFVPGTSFLTGVSSADAAGGPSNNLPLTISGLNGGGEFSGGNVLNSLRVTIFYNVVPIV